MEKAYVLEETGSARSLSGAAMKSPPPSGESRAPGERRRALASTDDFKRTSSWLLFEQALNRASEVEEAQLARLADGSGAGPARPGPGH